jgi:hypothetical protein
MTLQAEILEIAPLEEKIARLHKELAEAQGELEEMEQRMDALKVKMESQKANPGEGAEDILKIKWANKERLKAVMDESLRAMGIDPSQPALSADEIRDWMFKEGIKPEDRIASQAIMAMREE